MLFEIRLAIRRLLARPAFTLTAVLSLSLGIGAVTLFFSLLNSTLLKPLPVRNPAELHSLVDPRFHAPVVSNPNIRDLRALTTAFFQDVVSYRFVPANLGMKDRANSRAWGYLVSGNYFQSLGISAARGRLIQPSDDVTRGAHSVAVLSDLAWKRRFAADPNIAGQTVRVNGMPFTIIGVAPEGFYGTERFFAPELFFSASMSAQVELENSMYDDDRGAQNTFVLARLRPGVTPAQAQSQLDAATAQLAAQFPRENEGWNLTLTEPGWGGDFLRGPVVSFNVVLMGVAAALLLVVCVNLAGLLLAQAAERRKETAVRLALGANRAQLIRQLLLESLALASAGGAAGLLLASWTINLASNYRPPVDFAIQTRIDLDWRVAAFATLATLAASVIFGLAPALQATGSDLASAIKQDAADPRKRRWPLRDLLTGAQIAVSVVLLVCSGLMVKSLSNAMTVNLGFDPAGAATLGFDLSVARYPQPQALQFQQDLLRQIRALPGIASATLTGGIPLDINISGSSAYETGTPKPPPAQMPNVQTYWVMPDYVRTMRTPLLAGREYDNRDTKDRPKTVIVNREFVRAVLKLDDPAKAVGRRVETAGSTHEIVGVVENGKYLGLSEAPKTVMFLCAAQHFTAYNKLVWRASPGVPVAPSIDAVRGIVMGMNPDLALFDAETLEQHMNLPLLPARFAAAAVSAFGFITLFLAAVGVYGVTAFAVSRRTREIGIRMAIGAAPLQVARLFLRRASILIAISATAGAILAAFATGLLTPILIGVDATDWTAHATGIALMACIALAASLIPSWRAAGIDPATSLRRD